MNQTTQFRNLMPRGLRCMLDEKLSRSLQTARTLSPRPGKKTLFLMETFYLQGIQDALKLLGMEIHSSWVVLNMSGRTVAYDPTKVAKEQLDLANRILEWHGGQNTGLYALGSCMHHCAENNKIYRVMNFGGHESSGVIGRALHELRNLRADANFPEAVTDQDGEEANKLAADIEEFVTTYGCDLIPEFELDPPTPGHRLDTLKGRDVVARERAEEDAAHASAPRYQQAVLVEYNNAAPGIEIFEAAKPITIDMVANYLTERDDFNPERDGITFVDGVDQTATNLDDTD